MRISKAALLQVLAEFNIPVVDGKVRKSDLFKVEAYAWGEKFAKKLGLKISPKIKKLADALEDYDLIERVIERTIDTNIRSGRDFGEMLEAKIKPKDKGKFCLVDEEGNSVMILKGTEEEICNKLKGLS